MVFDIGCMLAVRTSGRKFPITVALKKAFLVPLDEFNDVVMLIIGALERGLLKLPTVTINLFRFEVVNMVIVTEPVAISQVVIVTPVVP
jgi:hypothetical protein